MQSQVIMNVLRQQRRQTLQGVPDMQSVVKAENREQQVSLCLRGTGQSLKQPLEAAIGVRDAGDKMDSSLTQQIKAIKDCAAHVQRGLYTWIMQ